MLRKVSFIKLLAFPARNALFITLACVSIGLLEQGAFAQEAPDALLESYCESCHNLEDFSGGVAFDLMDINNLSQDQEVWETAINKLRGRLMPPGGADQPPPGRR